MRLLCHWVDRIKNVMGLIFARKDPINNAIADLERKTDEVHQKSKKLLDLSNELQQLEKELIAADYSRYITRYRGYKND